MSADDLLQYLAQALFVVVFVVVAIRAVRRPRRATVDTALLFGVASLLIAEGWAAPVLHITPGVALTDATSSLLMALPYLLLRLVDDFAGVPRPIMGGAVAGLALSVISLFALAPTVRPEWLTLLYAAYFVVLTLYIAGAFVREAQRSSGVTRRRMWAMAGGSLCLGLTILFAGFLVAAPALAAWWTTLDLLCALASGLGYFLGFAPPAWLRRAWQEPEVRAFLGRAARLPRLPDTPAIVRELEQGAAGALGSPHAAIGLWDEAAGLLHFSVADAPAGAPADRSPNDNTISSRAFVAQQALLSDDALRDDPAHAALYRAHHVRAVLATPITAGEKRLGVLVVYAARAPIFAEDDLELAQLLADQAAVILESRALIDESARVTARAEATRLKDDFLSAAAHDLKTPLTTLIAQAQLLERRALRNPEAPPDLPGIQRMVREAQRLKSLVTDLLDVARVEQGKLVGKRETVDLVALTEEACARHSSPQHRCALEPAAPVVGDYDANRIMQLLDNLLDNAVKYSPDGDEVQVSVRGEEDGAHLTVTDHGIGIPASDLPHLFDRFHRGTNVDDRRFAGMGLGLYICRGIVEQHGGRLWATSPGPGNGSTFHVVLPLAASPRASGATEHANGLVRVAG